jgi:hypothetical protein
MGVGTTPGILLMLKKGSPGETPGAIAGTPSAGAASVIASVCAVFFLRLTVAPVALTISSFFDTWEVIETIASPLELFCAVTVHVVV